MIFAKLFTLGHTFWRGADDNVYVSDDSGEKHQVDLTRPLVVHTDWIQLALTNGLHTPVSANEAAACIRAFKLTVVLGTADQAVRLTREE